MRKNQRFYKVAVSKESESATLMVFSYELAENTNTYFFDLNMVVNNFRRSEVSMPDNRQANDKEELFIFGRTTLMISGNRVNETIEIQNKIEEFFGTNAKAVINKL